MSPLAPITALAAAFFTILVGIINQSLPTIGIGGLIALLALIVIRFAAFKE